MASSPSAAKWNILGTNDAHFNSLLGTVGVNNPYCFRAYDSGGTTLTDGSPVAINFATEVYDYNNNFAASAYTAPVNGVYNFSTAVSINGAVATGVEMYIAFYVAGVIHSLGNRVAVVATDSGLSMAADILLTAGQAVTVRFYQNSAGNEATNTTITHTWFAGHLVHAT